MLLNRGKNDPAVLYSILSLAKAAYLRTPRENDSCQGPQVPPKIIKNPTLRPKVTSWASSGAHGLPYGASPNIGPKSHPKMNTRLSRYSQKKRGSGALATTTRISGTSRRPLQHDAG